MKALAGIRTLGRFRVFVRAVSERRGAAALEFALVAIPFLVLLMLVMEISYDLFTQEIMDRTLYIAARELQTGNAQNAVSGSSFVTNYMAPALNGLLSPGNIYVQVQQISPGSGQDYYDFTTGVLPISNGSLDLSGFASGSFCNIGPSQWLLISAIYVGPTIVGALLPNILSQNYNGSLVHATLSTVGIVSENFPVTAATSGSASPCS